MKQGTDLERLLGDVGDLLGRHDEGADLEDFAAYRDDPVGFAVDVLGVEPWSRQREILEAVRDEAQAVVQGGNAVGKDWASAVAALWWAFARRGLVLATAAVERQLVDVFMGEVGRLWRGAPELPGELYRSALRVPREEQAGVVTFTSTEASKLTGYHAPRVLGVLTEAQAVEPFAWEGLMASATGPEDRLLAVGNPLRPDGRFFRASRSGAWRTVRIPVTEHPNLREDSGRTIPGGPSADFVERMEREWGEGSPQVEARVEARFPDTSEDALVEAGWLDRAFEAHRAGEHAGDVESEYAVLAVDVARFGRDRTVVCERRGRVVTGFDEWRGLDTRETAARVLRRLRELLDGDLAPAATVVVDVVGVGGGVADALRVELPELSWWESGARGRGLRERTPRLVEFNAGERAPDAERFRNLRSQAYWRLRTRLEEGELALPEDAGLRRELGATRTEVTSSGKVAVEAKDAIRGRLGGASPDRADALSMTFATELEEAGSMELVWT